MARINFSNNGTTAFERLLGHNIHILNHWNALEDSVFNRGHLSNELKEEVRRVLAYSNECHY